MGAIKTPAPVLLIIAAFSPSEETLALGKERAEKAFGPVWRESPVWRFDEFTHYYDQQMGPALLKRFWAFDQLIDPGRLAAIKVETNRWEGEIAEQLSAIVSSEGEESAAPAPPRPLNLDPGYIDLGKLILASTKDHAHRIYLSEGIFAETTLMYTRKEWRTLPWTYADYQSAGYQAFFTECREHLHDRRKLKMEN